MKELILRLFKKKAKSLAMEKYGKIVTAELDNDTTIYLDRPNEIVVRRSKDGDDGFLDILTISDIPSKTWSRIEKYLISLTEGHDEDEYENDYIQAIITKHANLKEKQ